jgi:hypothetical protein
MSCHKGGVLESSVDVFLLEEWIVLKDLFVRGAGTEQAEDVLHANAESADTGAASTNPVLNGDALKAGLLHEIGALRS